MNPSRTRVAIVGTPSDPNVEWTAERLARLVKMGFTQVQLNIAWSYRPADEALNLEDVWAVRGETVSAAELERRAERRADLVHRSGLAKAARLSTLFHFGAPYQGRNGYVGQVLPRCILDPSTIEAYKRAVSEFGAALPDVDSLLVYTYDQDAWLCSEFSSCERCTGVPLHERVTAFVNALAAGWRSVRPEGRVWWEPWELSAGQTLASIPLLDPTAVGLMLHGSIAEVISTIPADRFFQNAVSVATTCGIPVVAEAFLSSNNEEVEPWRELPVPLVTVRP